MVEIYILRDSENSIIAVFKNPPSEESVKRTIASMYNERVWRFASMSNGVFVYMDLKSQFGDYEKFTITKWMVRDN